MKPWGEGKHFLMVASPIGPRCSAHCQLPPLAGCELLTAGILPLKAQTAGDGGAVEMKCRPVTPGQSWSQQQWLHEKWS